MSCTDAIPDDDWEFIIAAVEAGWDSIRIWRDCRHLSFTQVLLAVKIVRDELGLDGRRRRSLLAGPSSPTGTAG